MVDVELLVQRLDYVQPERAAAFVGANLHAGSEQVGARTHACERAHTHTHTNRQRTPRTHVEQRLCNRKVARLVHGGADALADRGHH